MKALSFALLLGLAQTAWAAPALVTLTSGEVKVDEKPAPTAPFVLPDGAKLTLGAGASAVVLYEGTATRLRGPTVATSGNLVAPSTGGDPGRSALSAVIARDVSFAKTGAARGEAVLLRRPIPGGTLIALREIAWRCASCGVQTVEVYDFLRDRVVWSGEGSESVTYAGPKLQPGPYLVRVGTHEASVTIAPTEEADRVLLAQKVAREAEKSLAASGERDRAALTSVAAGLYFQAGLPSDALWTIDQAVRESPSDSGLLALQATYEQLAGIPAP